MFQLRRGLLAFDERGYRVPEAQMPGVELAPPLFSLFAFVQLLLSG